MSASNNEDVELVLKAKQNDEEAYNKLANKYMATMGKIINNVASSLSFPYYQEEEYLLCFSIALKIAIRNFDAKYKSFAPYFNLIFSREVKDTMLTEMNNMNMTISLDTHPVGDNLTLLDVLEDTSEILPSAYLNMDDAKLYLRSQSQILYSDIDNKIIMFKIFGYNLKEIAYATGATLSRVRRVIKEFKEENKKDLIVRLK